MICPNCNSPIENDAVFCGICGHQVAPLQAQGATIAADATDTLQSDNNRRSNQAGPGGHYPQLSFPPSAPPLRNYTPPGSYPPIDPNLTQPSPIPPSSFPPVQPSRRSGRRTTFIIALIVLVVVVISLGTSAIIRNNTGRTLTGSAGNNSVGNKGVAAQASGVAAFSDSQDGTGETNTVKISISGLQASPAGSQYNAWLLDEVDEKTLALGKLTNQGQTFSVTFTAQAFNLLSAGNKIEITQEQGNVAQPLGTVIMTGTFPPQAFIHIKHLLLAFPTTPHQVGLLVGLRDQSQKLNAQAQLLKAFMVNNNGAATRCAAQSIIDIAEGSHGAHYRPLPPECSALNVTQTGDGFGLLANGQSGGYIATAAAHASLAATRVDATPNIKVHAGHVEIATTNLKQWVGTIDQDARALLNNPHDDGKIQEIVTLANNSFNGVDIDNDEHVDPVAGEAGAITAYIHGQLMAQLTLAPGH